MSYSLKSGGEVSVSSTEDNRNCSDFNSKATSAGNTDEEVFPADQTSWNQKCCKIKLIVLIKNTLNMPT